MFFYLHDVSLCLFSENIVLNLKKNVCIDVDKSPITFANFILRKIGKSARIMNNHPTG